MKRQLDKLNLRDITQKTTGVNSTKMSIVKDNLYILSYVYDNIYNNDS